MRPLRQILRRQMPAGPGLALLIALCACEAPDEAEIPITEAAAARPAPQLVETALFTDALDRATPAIEALTGQREALAAQAEALRARAAALSGPVLDPAAQARLRAASAARAE